MKMDKKALNCLSWNVNSLSKRSTDVHSYVIENNIDVVLLQEGGMKGINYKLSGYQAFELNADDTSNTRGLITFVKNNIPATFIMSSKTNGTEIVCVSLKLKDTVVYVANIYVHADKFDVDDLPNCLFTEKCLLMGDLNARHHNLGTVGTPNKNGHILYNLLECIDDVKILGSDEPTHVRGGRIDYAFLFNMIDYAGDAAVVKDLLSDHFAIHATLVVEKLMFNIKRKIYNLKDDDISDFKNRIAEWYVTYKSEEGHNNDENKFYDDLGNAVDRALDKPREPKYVRCNSSRYVDDKIVNGWSKLLRKAQTKWSKNPGDQECKETM